MRSAVTTTVSALAADIPSSDDNTKQQINEQYYIHLLIHTFMLIK